jgi:hypothetical protein
MTASVHDNVILFRFLVRFAIADSYGLRLGVYEYLYKVCDKLS